MTVLAIIYTVGLFEIPRIDEIWKNNSLLDFSVRYIMSRDRF